MSLPSFRLVRNVACLCLPTLVVVVLAIRFALVELPRIVDDERERVQALSEAESRRLLATPESADFIWRRGEGVIRGAAAYAERFPAGLTWKDWDSAGRAKSKEMWGWFEDPAGRLVWVRDTRPGGDSQVVYGRQSGLSERNYPLWAYAFGGFSLLVLIGVTAVGVGFFLSSVRERDDFMAATAHDLTTPLVGMRYLIGRDDEAARCLNERLLRLVANVKDFMRLGGKRPRPQAEAFDLREALAEAYQLFRADFRDLFAGADVPVGGLEPGACEVRADRTMTLQILWNLFGNALKYAAPFGAVRIMLRGRGDRIEVDFIDEGEGMTAYERAHAFDRYYRAKTVLKSGKGGFGIGLCTASEMARAMAGELIVRANEPRGCVFTLTLPAANGHIFVAQ